MYKCKACGKEFELIKQLRSTVRNTILKGGISNAVAGENEVKLYDAFDCPYCGCQNVIGERLRYAEAGDFAKDKVKSDNYIFTQFDVLNNDIDKGNNLLSPSEKEDAEAHFKQSKEKPKCFGKDNQIKCTINCKFEKECFEESCKPIKLKKKKKILAETTNGTKI